MKRILLLLAVLIAPHVNAAEYFVATNGSSGNSGLSTNAPWPLKHALAQVVPGIIITVLPGTYLGGTAFYISETGDGTPANPATVRSQYKWQAVIANSTNTGFQLFGHNIILDGLCISNSLGAGFEMAGYSNTIRNCWVITNGFGPTPYSGMYSSSPGNSNNIIENNLLELNRSYGLYVSGPNNIIRNNVVRNNKGLYGIHYYTGYSTTLQWNNLFYNNLTYGHTNFGAIMVGAEDSAGPPGGNPGTNYFIGNTILDGLELFYGTAYVSNNIILPGVTYPTRPIYHQASVPTVTRADYNLSTVAYLTNGVNDVITNYLGFVNTNSGIYWLKSDSPARGEAKTTVFGPVNFFGNAQSSVADIGAFQYTATLAADRRVLDPSPASGANYWQGLGAMTSNTGRITNLRIVPQ